MGIEAKYISRSAQDDFDARYRAASQALADSVLRRIEIQAALKNAKGVEKERADHLSAIIAKGPESHPLFDGPPAAVAEAACDEGRPDDGNTVAIGDPHTNGEAWRGVLIDQLGLRPTLTEKLVEAGIETIGQLESARAGDGGLTAIRGIGRAKADAIEDAVVGWLSRNRDSAILSAARNGELHAEPVAEVLPPAADGIEACAAAIRAAGNLTSHANETVWEEGRDAGYDGEPLDACWYQWDSGNGEDWIKGWLYATEVVEAATE